MTFSKDNLVSNQYIRKLLLSLKLKFTMTIEYDGKLLARYVLLTTS